VEKAIPLKMYFPDQEEYRSSGVQEFRSSEVQKNSELGTLLRRGATSQAYSWVSSPH